MHNSNDLITDTQRRQIVAEHIQSWNIAASDAALLLRLDGNHPAKSFEDFCSIGSFTLTNEQRLRIDLLITIYRLLDGLYPENPNIRDAWMNHPNPLLEGRTALDIACHDEDGLSILLGFLMHKCIV